MIFQLIQKAVSIKTIATLECIRNIDVSFSGAVSEFTFNALRVIELASMQRRNILYQV